MELPILFYKGKDRAIDPDDNCENRDSGMSALFGIQSLFSSLAPAICGFVGDRFGILYSFYFLAATVFVANFLVYMIPEKPLREEGAELPEA